MVFIGCFAWVAGLAVWVCDLCEFVGLGWVCGGFGISVLGESFDGLWAWVGVLFLICCCFGWFDFGFTGGFGVWGSC